MMIISKFYFIRYTFWKCTATISSTISVVMAVMLAFEAEWISDCHFDFFLSLYWYNYPSVAKVTKKNEPNKLNHGLERNF